MTINLNYKEFGEGQTIMILHGLFGSLDNWQTMAKSMSSHGYHVVIVDLRNHGKSPHSDEMNHEIMAQDVAELIIANQWNDVFLIGHSMGGKTAMQLALHVPDLLSKLVVVDIAPKAYSPHHNAYFDALTDLDTTSIESRSDAEEQLRERIKSPAVLQFLLKNLARQSDGSYNWKFNLAALEENYHRLINGIISEKPFEKPTLFISGQLSDYISPGDYGEMEKLFPNSEVVVIQNAGHWVHAEQPKEFESIVLEFLED